MHPKLTRATMRRVLTQLLHDPRTIGLMFVVPCVLLGLLAWMYQSTPHMFDRVGPALLGIFPFVVMFLITSVATLRERSSGTLERLMALPIGKFDFILGYALAFGLLAVVQATLASEIAIHVYGMHVAGPEYLVLVVALADALLGMALGLFVSAFARTEFQAVQFLPALILPQFLLCGLLVAVDALPGFLHGVAKCLPLTYAVDAMGKVSAQANIPHAAYHDILVVVAFGAAALMLGAATLRRSSR
jgi:ABC-2 type transport system permease protein